MKQQGISRVLLISLIAVVVLGIIYIVSPKTGEAPIVGDELISTPTSTPPVSTTKPAVSKPAQTTTTPKPATTSTTKKVATILFPAGGENLLVGRTYNIRWSDYTSLEPMTIVLQTINTDGKSSLKNIAVNVPATVAGSYPWVVPYEGSENRYRVQIFPSDKRTLAVSSKDFRITLYDVSATKSDPSGSVVPYATPATGYAPLITGFSIPEVPGLDYANSDFIYIIDFGDGSVIEPFSKVPPFSISHTYAQPGTYQAKISKKTGCTDIGCAGPSEVIAVLVVKVDKRP